MDTQRTIVISAVNLVSGGPFTILRECIEYMSSSGICNNFRVIFLIHKRSPEIEKAGVELMEFPRAKKNWINRIYYEYYGFRKLSLKLKPYIWISLHDMTPNTKAEKRVVYMHNPAPLYKWKSRDILHSFTYVLFALFYKYLYRINIHSNDYLIVQQDGVRSAFSKMLGVDKKKIIVSHPIRNNAIIKKGDNNSVCRFFYPALPRPFKNFEVICEAVLCLEREGIDDFEVCLTIDGTENKYSNKLIRKYSGIESIKFLGLISREEVEEYYSKTDCLLFPSVVETWGLPVSEFARYGKPMLIADMPYARETAGGSGYTSFFNPHDPKELAGLMHNIIKKDFSGLNSVPCGDIPQLFAGNWKEMFDILL